MSNSMDGEDWASLARNILRAEMMRRGMSYARLAEALEAIGVEETEAGMKNKVSRGRFTFVFFLQCMVALRAETIVVPRTETIPAVVGKHGAQLLAREDKSVASDE